jgi:hypothetical protein
MNERISTVLQPWDIFQLGESPLGEKGNRRPCGSPTGCKVEEPIMDEISNTTSVNLEKFIFGIFLTLANRNNNIAKKKKEKQVCMW